MNSKDSMGKADLMFVDLGKGRMIGFTSVNATPNLRWRDSVLEQMWKKTVGSDVSVEWRPVPVVEGEG
jgi:hypothetical protein